MVEALKTAKGSGSTKSKLLLSRDHDGAGGRVSALGPLSALRCCDVL